MTFNTTGIATVSAQAPADVAPGRASDIQLVDEVADVFGLALRKYREELNADPVGIMSFDVNGLLVTLNGYRFDPEIGAKLAAARAAGWLVMISTANDLGSTQRYMKHIGVSDSTVDIWNCGNGKNIYVAREGGGFLRHTNVPADVREKFAQMMSNIARDIGELCASENIEWQESHPTLACNERPSDGYRLVAGYDGKFGEDPRISFTLQGWDENGRKIDPDAIRHIGQRILTDILPRYPDFVIAGRPELDGANGFIYITGNGVKCAKATYIAAARDYFRANLNARFVVAHAGDNHNEFGCEAAGLLFAPADADACLVQHLSREALHYDWQLKLPSPYAAGEFIERVTALATNC
jgi:hypothetical protein